jgi:OHCU decarboxylase
MPTSTLATLNRAEREPFVAELGDIFEHAPWVAEAAWVSRPFADLDALHRAMVAVIEGAGERQQLELIRNHPDLAGRAAIAGDLTEASQGEQAGAGLNRLTPDEFERFQRLNGAYRDRFAFPYILAVAGHDKHSILSDFETRLGHDPATELRRALDEIARIGRFRLEALLAGG